MSAPLRRRIALLPASLRLARLGLARLGLVYLLPVGRGLVHLLSARLSAIRLHLHLRSWLRLERRHWAYRGGSRLRLESRRSADCGRLRLPLPLRRTRCPVAVSVTR